MGIEVAYDADHCILRGSIAGAFDLDAYRDMMAQIGAGTFYPVDTPAIWDLRGMDFDALDTDLGPSIKQIRSTVPERATTPIAYVVPDILGYGMLRTLQTLLGTDAPETSLVSYDYTEAEAWLLERVRTRTAPPSPSAQ